MTGFVEISVWNMPILFYLNGYAISFVCGNYFKICLLYAFGFIFQNKELFQDSAPSLQNSFCTIVALIQVCQINLCLFLFSILEERIILRFGSIVVEYFIITHLIILQDLLELCQYKLAAELVLSKDNKQQCFKLFKALKNRAIGIFFFFFKPFK